MKHNDLRRCKAILFDFGGTLDSDGEHWLDRFYDLYDRLEVDVPRGRIKQVFYQADDMCCADPLVNQMGLRPLMRHHIRFQFSMHSVSDPAKEDRMLEEFCSPTERCLERNAKLLKRLRGSYRMGVVSNFYGNVETLCDEAGLSEFLLSIQDSTRLGIGKPDAEIFRRALTDLNVTPGSCIFVGDSYDRDMVPAGDLGMRTIWIKGPNPRLPAEPKPMDGVISSLLELESMLL